MREETKVCQIGLSYSEYAQGIITENIHKALNENNIENYVLCIDRYDITDPNVICVESHLNNIIKRGLRKLFGKHQFAATLTTISLLKKLANIKPDIIHIHNIHHLTINYIMLYKYIVRHNIKLVVTLHDMWPITGGCYHFSDIGCEEYRNECKHCPKLPLYLDCPKKETYGNYVFKKNCYDRLAVKFVAVSDWVYNEVQNTYLRDFDVSVIKNPLNDIYGITDNKDFFKNDNRTAGKKIILGVSNYWTDDKGLSDFYALHDLLDDSFCIVLIGTPPAEIPEKPNLVFYGKISEASELRKAYNSADVFVHLSKAETFGMVIAEASACGTVTVGYDTTGMSEVINACHGVSVSLGDIKGVFDAIYNICSNNKSLSYEQAAEIKKSFSADVMKDRYLKIYDDF